MLFDKKFKKEGVMFIVFPIIGLLLLSLYSMHRIRQITTKNLTRTGDWEFCIVVSSVIIICLILIELIITPIEIYKQRKDYMSVLEYNQRETIYEKKAKALTKEFASYLATTYPEYEKNIYNSIKPNKIDIYLVKYPELKTADTIMALVTEISKLQADKYEQQLLKTKYVRRMKFRSINPWLLSWFIPTFEKLEQKYGTRL